MEQTNMNFFQRMFYSISHFSFYKRVVKETTGKAIGYLFLFSIILGIITMLKPVVEVITGVDAFSELAETNLPDFTFANGELTVAGEMPMVFEENGSVFIIDTSGATDESVLDNYDSGYFISSTYMVNKKSFLNTETFNFSPINTLTFDKDQIVKWVPLLKFFALIMAFFILVFTVIGKLIGSLVIAVLAVIISACIKGSLNFSEAYRIGVYAMTLPSIIKIIVSFLPIEIPFFFVIYYIVAGVYIAKAIQMILEERALSQHSQPFEPSNRQY